MRKRTSNHKDTAVSAKSSTVRNRKDTTVSAKSSAVRDHKDTTVSTESSTVQNRKDTAVSAKSSTVRNHKDTVFRMLFRQKKELLTLYNALNGTNYSDESCLETYTLENAIYMSVKNDVSFLLDSELNLYEHQGSFSPNMPLRDLSYIARQIERYTRDVWIYSSTQVKIPVPRFVVFYNGSTDQPEQRILKLSDAYEKKTADPQLELKVQMLNINYGKNRELMERCETLKGYSILVARIRSYAKKQPIDKAVDRAVTECIQENILAEFLKAQRAEVKAMSIFEYNEEEERRKMLREQERILEEETQAALEKGRAEGRLEGRAEGLAKGYAESVLSLLSGLGAPEEALKTRILNETDLSRIQEWLRLASKASSLEEFAEKMK